MKISCEKALLQSAISLASRTVAPKSSIHNAGLPWELGLAETPPEYEELKAYACWRLERCRWQEAKPACKRCPTHCYAPAMRQRIREVMRWTGPRMLLYAPVAAIRHWI